MSRGKFSIQVGQALQRESDVLWANPPFSQLSKVVTKQCLRALQDPYLQVDPIFQPGRGSLLIDLPLPRLWTSGSKNQFVWSAEGSV